MKQDIAVVVDSITGARDIAIGNDGDLLAVEGFETSIDLSILTDGRASESEVSRAEDRRGWIGDLVQDTGENVGSTLWLYEQRRIDQSVLNAISDSARKALEWMVTRGIAKDVNAVTTQTSPFSVRLETTVNVGSDIVTRYFDLWDNTQGI